MAPPATSGLSLARFSRLATALLHCLAEESAARPTAGDVHVVRGAVEDMSAVEKGLEDADATIYPAIQGTQGASDVDRAPP